MRALARTHAYMRTCAHMRTCARFNHTVGGAPLLCVTCPSICVCVTCPGQRDPTIFVTTPLYITQPLNTSDSGPADRYP